MVSKEKDADDEMEVCHGDVFELLRRLEDCALVGSLVQNFMAQLAKSNYGQEGMRS